MTSGELCVVMRSLTMRRQPSVDNLVIPVQTATLLFRAGISITIARQIQGQAWTRCMTLWMPKYINVYMYA